MVPKLAPLNMVPNPESQMISLRIVFGYLKKSRSFYNIFQKTAFSLVFLFNHLSTLCQNWLIHKKMVLDYVQLIRAIGKIPYPGQTTPHQTREARPDKGKTDHFSPDQTRNDHHHDIYTLSKCGRRMFQAVFCIDYTGSCSFWSQMQFFW